MLTNAFPGSPLLDLMARPSLIRHINQTRVLRLLKEEGTLSRAELARSLNLTRSTLTAVTDELMEMDLVIEAGESFITQATGRPGTGLKLNPEGAFFLGAEISVEHIHLVLINLEGSIIYRETTKVGSTRPEAVCRDLVDLVQRVWSVELKSSDRLRGVGITVSALVDTQGVIRSAPTFRWHHVDLKSAITAELLNIPIFVENDANGAALAELSFGRRKSQSDLCLLFLDVGVGAGLVFDRKIFRGSDGLAGEIGHLTLDPASNAKAEGMGSLETHLGRDALLASYRRLGGKAKDIKTFLQDLRKEVPRAQKIVGLWGEWLTLAIRNLADLFNPKRVILAGSLSELFRFVEEDVRRHLRERRFPTVDNLEIALSSFGKDSSALGGAALVFDRIFSVPDSNFLHDFDSIESSPKTLAVHRPFFRGSSR
jgi:predicted NBD/HSP70 family sugar kinase